MAYSDKTYFLTKIKSSELDNLITDQAGAPQDAYITEAVKAADNLINSYVRNVVNVIPLDPVPDVVRQYSYFIAMYYLHDRIQYNDIPERVKDNYDVAINFLKDLAAGKASLEGVEEDDIDAQIDYEVNENIFTRNIF